MRARLAKLLLASGALIVGAYVSASGGAGNTTGIGGIMPAYYDHQLFTINFFQLTTAQATLLAKNSQQNFIYQSDPGLPGGQPFISVIDAIPSDGMNPLWAEIQIAFTAGHTPRQLFSDDEIAAAFASGEITLTPTHEMYRCSVIGRAIPTVAASRTTNTFGSTRSVPAATGTPGVQVTSWGAVKMQYR
jgi:hypothetical protein